MSPRRRERQLTPAEHKAYLYHASSEKFCADCGSDYPCDQDELDFHRRGRFLRPNKGPFVSLLAATEELMVQNDKRRRPPIAEIDAISTLEKVLSNRTYRYHPDLVIKAFNDLDTVFFGGKLHGNVLVSWPSDGECTEIELRTGEFYGCTQSRYREEKGQARIFMNARAIFLDDRDHENPLRAMFSTLLHEMVHAYQFVRCAKHAERRDPHDKYFATSVDAVHKRAFRILDIDAIGEWESYQQEFRFESSVDDAYINRSHSTYGSSRHDDPFRHDHKSHSIYSSGRYNDPYKPDHKSHSPYGSGWHDEPYKPDHKSHSPYGSSRHNDPYKSDRKSHSTYGSSRHDNPYRHDHSSHKHGKDRRDERDWAHNGDGAGCRGEVVVVGCSVM